MNVIIFHSLFPPSHISREFLFSQCIVKSFEPVYLILLLQGYFCAILFLLRKCMSTRHGRLQKYSQIHAFFQQGIVAFIDLGRSDHTRIKGLISRDKPPKPIIIEGCEHCPK